MYKIIKGEVRKRLERWCIVGWFVVYCIQQSQNNIGVLHTAIIEKM